MKSKVHIELSITKMFDFFVKQYSRSLQTNHMFKQIVGAD